MTEWIAVIAVVQTAVMMVAGFYVWRAGRSNADLERRDKTLKLEILDEVKGLMREDRHSLRTDLHGVMARLQQELGNDLDAVNRRIDGILGQQAR